MFDSDKHEHFTCSTSKSKDSAKIETKAKTETKDNTQDIIETKTITKDKTEDNIYTRIKSAKPLCGYECKECQEEFKK